MPKLRVTCRDCPCCESLPGGTIGLCWRPPEGPQVIDTTTAGFCGDELIDEHGGSPGGLTPRQLWLTTQGYRPERLAEVEQLLGLASAGARKGLAAGAIELLLLVLKRQGCNATCADGGYPDCEKEAGLACGTMLRAREIWAVICLLRGELKA